LTWTLKTICSRQQDVRGTWSGKALTFTSRRRSKKAFAAASPVNNVRYSSWKWVYYIVSGHYGVLQLGAGRI